ncbi:MAG: hypothetical protein MMC33_002135 [Icmadophila ericetorum]|nr:hypothetical protein [Icmadophila ericetorum]
MSYKRSRATFEADLQAQQSPYVLYGTPLPPLDPETRDDGSYVPVWKQEVTDERGRKRLHGAFTGGFSAGYFNTVGSREGWTPSTFVSSKVNKKKDAPTVQQKPEDFMDEEDLAEAEEARKLQTTDSFTGLGSTEIELSKHDDFAGILRSSGETMGVKLLKRMGWREGQGVGPKVRRKARGDHDFQGNGDRDGDGKRLHYFAPKNSQMISFVRKNDHKGLGFQGEVRLGGDTAPEFKAGSGVRLLGFGGDRNENDVLFSTAKSKKKPKPQTGGIGIGILNDTGSDDEDPYQIGPQISYNRVMGGDKKGKKKLAEDGKLSTTSSNPLLRSKPVFISKKTATSKLKPGFRRCHDGRLPLDGFVLSANLDPLSSALNLDNKFPLPIVPPHWKSSKTSRSDTSSSIQSNNAFQSTADAARASTLDPTTRAKLLGETALPGKSVFDYLSPAAREKIANLTKNPNLPPALNEAPPPGYAPTPSQRNADLNSLIPNLDASTAQTALGRGVGGWMPYAEDPAKRSRYRTFLESRAGLSAKMPDRAEGHSTEDWVNEMNEFARAAQVFKPMMGLMASRFTSSSSGTTQPPSKASAGDKQDGGGTPLLSKPAEKPKDPAEEAASLGMFGPLTRSSHQFYPTRLLCKRFNIPPPTHVQPDKDHPPSTSPSVPDFGGSRFQSGGYQGPTTGTAGLVPKNLELVGKKEMEALRRESGMLRIEEGGGDGKDRVPEAVVVDPERNEALEADRAGEAVFKAVFGSDSEDD